MAFVLRCPNRNRNDSNRSKIAIWNRSALLKIAAESPLNLLNISVEIALWNPFDRRFRIACRLDLKLLAIWASKHLLRCALLLPESGRDVLPVPIALVGVNSENSRGPGCFWDLLETFLEGALRMHANADDIPWENPQQAIIICTNGRNTRIMMDFCRCSQGMSSEFAWWIPETPYTIHPQKKSRQISWKVPQENSRKIAGKIRENSPTAKGLKAQPASIT